MVFFEAINSVFAGTFKFTGRATRPEYWWFFLFDVLVGFAAITVDVLMLMSVTATSGSLASAVLSLSPLDFMTFYYLVITFIPRLSVTIRRLHDVGLSGFFYLLYFVPLVGALVVFVLTLLPSEADDNIHGPGPFHRGGGTPPATPGTGNGKGGKPRKHDPMQGYAVLYKVNDAPTPEMIAARKAEVRALYEQRVLGKAPIVAE
ncbi:MAG: DUF805 domain-containing protein [Pseudomonadota bacterium]